MFCPAATLFESTGDDSQQSDETHEQQTNMDSRRGEGAEAAAAVVAAAVEIGPDLGGAPPEPHGRGGRGGGAEPDEVEDFNPEWTGFRGAVSLLENADDRRPVDLFVSNIPFDRDDARFFPRFVALLGQGEGGRTVRRIGIAADWRRLPSEDVVRLLRDVLPTHPTVDGIFINLCFLPTKVSKLLTEAHPTENGDMLRGIAFTGAPPGHAIDQQNSQEKLQAIIDLMNRNAATTHLAFAFDLHADQARRICRSLPRNTKLWYLSLRVTEVFADTLDGVATSSLSHLWINSSFSEDAVPSLARQLRTNETLESIELVDAGADRRDSQALLDLAKTYNFTLRTIVGNLGSGHGDARVRERFDQYMRRNSRVRDAFKELQDPYFHCTVPSLLLPRLLGLVSDLPTALRRILRMGYVNAVSDLLVAAAAQGTASSTSKASEPRRRSPRLAKRRRLLGADGEPGSSSAM